MCLFCFRFPPAEGGYTSLSSFTRVAVSLKLSSVGEKVLGRSLFWSLVGGTKGEGSGPEEFPPLPVGFSSFICETTPGVKQVTDDSVSHTRLLLCRAARTSAYEGFGKVVLGFSFFMNKLHFDSCRNRNGQQPLIPRCVTPCGQASLTCRGLLPPEVLMMVIL